MQKNRHHKFFANLLPFWCGLPWIWCGLPWIECDSFIVMKMVCWKLKYSDDDLMDIVCFSVWFTFVKHSSLLLCLSCVRLFGCLCGQCVLYVYRMLYEMSRVRSFWLRVRHGKLTSCIRVCYGIWSTSLVGLCDAGLFRSSANYKKIIFISCTRSAASELCKHDVLRRL